MHLLHVRVDKMIKPCFICKNKVTVARGWVSTAVPATATASADWGDEARGQSVHTHTEDLGAGKRGHVPFGYVPQRSCRHHRALWDLFSHVCTGTSVHHRQNSGPGLSWCLLCGFCPAELAGYISRGLVPALKKAWQLGQLSKPFQTPEAELVTEQWSSAVRHCGVIMAWCNQFLIKDLRGCLEIKVQ